MHNPESVKGNETHKIIWDFVILMDHLISARRPDLVIVNKEKREKKENLLNCGLFCTGWCRVKPKEPEKKNKYVHLARELIKSMEYESGSDMNCN